MNIGVSPKADATIELEIQRFLDQHAARSPHTAHTYRTGLTHFTTYLAERDIELSDSPARLTRAVALDFIPWLARQRFRRGKDSPEQPLSMRSRQLYVRAVSGLYKQLALESAIPLSYTDYAALNDEMGKATSFKPSPIEKRLPPDDVIQAIIEAVGSPPAALSRDDLDERQRRRLNLIWLRDQAIILCLYSSGMRVGELVSLRRGDLDYADHGAWVRGKGDRPRFVRFSQGAWGALIAYLGARRDETGALAIIADCPSVRSPSSAPSPVWLKKPVCWSVSISPPIPSVTTLLLDFCDILAIWPSLRTFWATPILAPPVYMPRLPRPSISKPTKACLMAKMRTKAYCFRP
ncbi:MAG: tyrosine-type recombinase/integrase [Anaerolineae bacterium]